MNGNIKPLIHGVKNFRQKGQCQKKDDINRSIPKKNGFRIPNVLKNPKCMCAIYITIVPALRKNFILFVFNDR